MDLALSELNFGFLFAIASQDKWGKSWLKWQFCFTDCFAFFYKCYTLTGHYAVLLLKLITNPFYSDNPVGIKYL